MPRLVFNSINYFIYEILGGTFMTLIAGIIRVVGAIPAFLFAGHRPNFAWVFWHTRPGNEGNFFVPLKMCTQANGKVEGPFQKSLLWLTVGTAMNWCVILVGMIMMIALDLTNVGPLIIFELHQMVWYEQYLLQWFIGLVTVGAIVSTVLIVLTARRNEVVAVGVAWLKGRTENYCPTVTFVD